jgi:uncharacterized membrane protein HdeD (DUF308 family)
MQEPLLVGVPSEPSEGEPLWWIPLVTGALWVIFALIVFQFDYTSVSALSILLGTVCMAAGLFEAVTAAGTHGWWRTVHIVLAIVFAAIGTAAYIHPENTFKALASIFAFYLLLRGIFDIVIALFARPAELWWVGGQLRTQGIPARRLGRRVVTGTRRRPGRDCIPSAARAATSHVID